MTRHHWRRQIRSFFESHADPDTDETFKQTQKDMAEKKERIIKLIKGTEEARDVGGASILIRSPSRNDQLQELVEDFHKQYQTLYERYENLAGDLKKKGHSKRQEDDEDDENTSSDSESELDDQSAKGKKGGKRNRKLESDNVQQELQIAKDEILDLKKKLIAATNGKEIAEQIIDDLKVDRENWKQDLMGENEDLKARVDCSVKLEAEQNQITERLMGKINLLLQEKQDITKPADLAESTLEEVKAMVVVLKNEKESLNAELQTSRQEVSDLKNLLDARNLEISRSAENKKAHMSDSSARIIELEGKLNGLEVDLDDLKSKKIIAEEELVNQTTELSILREKCWKLEEMIKEGNKLYEQGFGSQIDKENEHKSGQSKEELVAELQKTIEYLKSDIEEEREEIFSVEEKNRTLEVKLRLSNQKVRLTEQLLAEKEEIHRYLEKKNSALFEAVKTYNGMVKDITTQVNDSLNGFELSVLKKFEDDYKGISKKVLTASDEIQSVESWVKSVKIKEEEMEKIKKDGSVMKEKIERLEEEVNREKMEKEEMARMLSQVEKTVDELGMKVKEYDERLMCLGEEKRQAIRQLALWGEYQRSRCNELKGVILRTSRTQRAN